MRITWAGKLNLTAQLTTSQIATAGASSRLVHAYCCMDAVQSLKLPDLVYWYVQFTGKRLILLKYCLYYVRNTLFLEI